MIRVVLILYHRARIPAACRGGDYAWIGNNSGDVVERRDLDGSNPVEYDPNINIILHTIFATEDRVHFVNQSTGATTAIDFDGTLQAGDNLALGSGRWRASFVLFEEAAAGITITTDQSKIYEGDSKLISILCCQRRPQLSCRLILQSQVAR